MAVTPMTNANGQQVSQPNVEPYFQQQQNPTLTGGINNLVRALLAGNDAYKQQQQAQGNQQLSPGSAVPGAVGPSSVGGPNGPSPLQNMPTDPSSMTGSTTGTPPAPPVAATSPTPQFQTAMGSMGAPSMSGISPDPVTQALMSPIPGMSGS